MTVSARSCLSTRPTSRHPGGDQDASPPPPTRHCALRGFVLGKGVRAAVGTGQELKSRLFSPRVVVDMPASLAPAQGCVVAVVDAARVVAKGIQLVHGASFGVRDHQSLQSELCPLLLPPSPSRSSSAPSLPHSPALSLAKSPRLSRCSGKSTPTELFLMEPREAENRLRSKLWLRRIWEAEGL